MNAKLKELRDRLPERQAVFVENLFSGMTRPKAYKNAGYEVRDNDTAARCAWRLLNKNENVLAYYEALKKGKDDNTIRTLNITRTTQIKSLRDTFLLAERIENPSAMVSALREINEMMGYHRENAPNAEKEAAKAARMSREEKEIARLLAQQRTAELAGGAKIVPFNAG